MKYLTNKTIIVQEDKTYIPIEIEGTIYWIDKEATINEQDYYYNFDYNYIKLCLKISKEFIKNALYYEENSTVFDYSKDCGKIVAQSDDKLSNIPIINLDDYWENVHCRWIKWTKRKPKWNGSVYMQFNGKNQGIGFVFQGKLNKLSGLSESEFHNYEDSFYWLEQIHKPNPNQYTLEDIKIAIKLAQTYEKSISPDIRRDLSFGKEKIINHINQISTVEIDKQFNIIKY